MNLFNTYKIKKCLFMSETACPRGSFCVDYHDYLDRRRNPRVIYYSPDKCPNAFDARTQQWSIPNCENSDSCPLAHSEIEVFYHYLIYRTFLCQYYKENDPNSCGWKNVCSGAHGQEQLRHPDKASFQASFNHQASSTSGQPAAAAASARVPAVAVDLGGGRDILDEKTATNASHNQSWLPSQAAAIVPPGTQSYGIESLSKNLGDMSLGGFQQHSNGFPTPTTTPITSKLPPTSLNSVGGSIGSSIGGSVGSAGSLGGVVASPNSNGMQQTPQLGKSPETDAEIVNTLKQELQKLAADHNILKNRLRQKEEDVEKNVRMALEEKEKERVRKQELQKEELQQIVRKEREKAEMLHQRVQCPVCYDRDRDAVVVPCGHVFCQKCVSRSQESKTCWICKQKYYHIQMIYL